MATIQSIEKLADDIRLFGIATESIKDFQPGQFVQLSVPGVGEMPISFCGIPAVDGIVELCVRSVGRVSSALLKLSIGAELGIRGPLGQGFPMADYNGKNLILIAGGVGMAPIRSLLLTVLQNRMQYGTITVLHGARSRVGLLFEAEMRSFAHNRNFLYKAIAECADEWSGGECLVGLLPELLDSLTPDPEMTAVALCAPPVAYPVIVEKLRQLGIDDASIHLSLERHMKCGVGHCGHCAVGSMLCCIDGPVFSLSRLSTERGVVL